MKRNGLFAALLLGAVYSLSACATPVRYSAEAIEAQIVDADTKKPIEGAVVVAHWVLEGGMHTDRVGDLKILESVTDANGIFRFPAWGPVTHWGLSRLTDLDPEILIFKGGYKYQILSNYDSASGEQIEGKAFTPRRSQWNGRTIELKPFKGTVEQYATHLGFIDTSLESILAEECGWKKIPRMILAISEQSEIFRKHRIYELPSIDSLEVRYRNSIDKCGSVKAFYRSFQP